jgi:4-hydroxybenzoyl-CoA reductase subunit beta
MMPLKPFSLQTPRNLAELKNYLSTANAQTKIMAGGTDLLPNLKHNLYNINTIISLKFLRELFIYDFTPDSITLGAHISLDFIATNAIIKELFPALSYAASCIASPHLRRMGTVGGNICLDTRCAYFNQSEFWRKALNYCLKKDGNICHVTKTGKRCVAASSNDLATILLAYDADVSILSSENERVIALRDFYTTNGEKNTILSPQEVITGVYIKKSSQMRAGFAKLRHRESIDFPLLSIGVAFNLDQENTLQEGRLVINALVAKPKLFDLANYKSRRYTSELVLEIARHAREKCHPQTNIFDDCRWRKQMIESYVVRAFMQAQSWSS